MVKDPLRMVKDPVRAHDATVGAEAVLQRTGRTREDWFALLDAAGATAWAHGPIAAWLVDQGVDGWWAQSLTVGYEQARGLRRPGQRPDGAFEANVTRTLPVPTDVTLAWLTDPDRRRRWLEVEPELRSTRAVRSLRWGWPDGTRVTMHVHGAAGDRTRLSVQHRVPDDDGLADLKQAWVERFDRLAAAIADGA